VWRERTKQDRHEIPSGTGFVDPEAGGFQPKGGSLVETDNPWLAHRHPENEYQAMMEVIPHTEIPATEAELEEEWSQVEATIRSAGLSEMELAVVEMTAMGEMSYRECGVYLGREFPRETDRPYSKMTVSRIRDRALDKLRKVYEHDDHTG